MSSTIEFIQQFSVSYPLAQKIILGVLFTLLTLSIAVLGIRFIFGTEHTESLNDEDHRIPLGPPSQTTDSFDLNKSKPTKNDTSPDSSIANYELENEQWSPKSNEQWQQRENYLRVNRKNLLATYIPIIIFHKSKKEFIFLKDFPFSHRWLNFWQAGFYTPELQIVLLSMLERYQPANYKKDMTFILNYQNPDPELQKIKQIFSEDLEQARNTLLQIKSTSLPYQVLLSRLLEVQGNIFSRSWLSDWNKRLGEATMQLPAVLERVKKKASLALKMQLAQRGHMDSDQSWRDFIRRQVFYHGNYKRVQLLNLDSEPRMGLLQQKAGNLDEEMLEHADTLFKNQVFEKIHRFKLRFFHRQSPFKDIGLEFSNDEIEFFEERFSRMPSKIKNTWLNILKEQQESARISQHLATNDKGIRRCFVLRQLAEQSFHNEEYSKALQFLKRALNYDQENYKLIEAGFLYASYANDKKSRQAFFSKLRELLPELTEDKALAMSKSQL